MGWKNVKDHYKIEHIVRANDKGILIGSQMIGDLIVIGWDGTMSDNYGVGTNEDLHRYWHEMEADIDTLKRLMHEPDTFERSIPVYTYEKDVIVTLYCEEYGYPNVTHDGQVMYHNTFFLEQDKAIARAKQEAALGVKLYQRRIDEVTSDLAELQSTLKEEGDILARLNEKHPDVHAAD